jgi:ribosomal protein S18 acetylase RimI-like enzyme
VSRPGTRPTVRLRTVRSATELEQARTLFGEYGRSLGVDLGVEGFREEVRSLPDAYAPPRGELLLAFVETTAVGCVAVRPLSRDVGEMKRLFVRPGSRGLGIGRALVRRIAQTAREAGFRSLRLDTLPEMTSAAALYRSLGFEEIPAYRVSPFPGTRYFELDLVSPPRAATNRRGTNK